MKSVLLSVQSYWVFLIIAKAMGWNYPQEKTVEVRKTFPEGKEWNRIVEIYCTKDKASFKRIPKEYQPLMEKFLGKVVGEFICYKNTNLVHVGTMGSSEIELVINNSVGSYSQLTEKWLSKTCLSLQKLENYSHGRTLYTWHISNLKIYDKPKELNEFIVQAFPKSYGCCENCLGSKCNFFDAGYGYVEDDCNAAFDTDEYKPLTRPPQSWCYVEETQDERI